MKVLVRKTDDPFDDEVVEQSRWLRTMDPETGAPLSNPGWGYSKPVEVPDIYIGKLLVSDFDVTHEITFETDEVTGEKTEIDTIYAVFDEERCKERLASIPAETYL